MKTLLQVLVLAIFALTFLACDGAGIDGTPPKLGQKGGKADEWGPSDDPNLFSQTLEYRLDALPQEGEAESIPWAGSYWPVHEDSINKRWAGVESYSPAEKYGQAFGIEGIEDAVSSAHGIDAQSSRKSCTSSSDCSEPGDGSCSKRRFASDDDEGTCIPTWWGICHAWAPAAILEPEPQFPVTKNGVEFKVNDIKALLTLVYNRTASKFISLRCNTDSDDIEYDLYDRPVDQECKNTNPGTLHVILANYLGLMKQAFAEDRTFDDEVWNQPVRSFKVTEMTELTPKDANMKVGVEEGPGLGQVVGFDGEVEAGQWQHGGPYNVSPGNTIEATLAASSTADNRADLYVRFGSQPDASSFDCGPSSEASNQDCELVVPQGQTQVYISVLAHSGNPEFVVEADLDKGNIVAVPETYMFNDNARKLYFVKTEVKYISESASHVDGNLSGSIDNYTRTDRYQYILELDDAGKIIGGEWIGSSKKSHPDFLWLPTGRYSIPVAQGKITYDNVKDLLDESQAPPTGEDDPTGATMVTTVENGSVAQDAFTHFGPYDAGTGTFAAVLTGSGDGDLYVKNGSQPTDSDWDCRPYQPGTSESCMLQGPGTFYVAVHGFAAADFEIKLSYTDPAAPTDPTTPADPPATADHITTAGHVETGQMVHYSMEVKAHRPVVIRTECTSDIDLYARMNVKPSEAVYDQRAYTYSGNETLTILPSADGTLHIGVHGYEAGDFTLYTADE